jgi:hypothetical protein
MRRYLNATPEQTYLEGIRVVHNFWPGPPEDPGQDRKLGANGFRVWVTDEPNENEKQCHCGWLNGREHFGTIGTVSSSGQRIWRGRALEQ